MIEFTIADSRLAGLVAQLAASWIGASRLEPGNPVPIYGPALTYGHYDHLQHSVEALIDVYERELWRLLHRLSGPAAARARARMSELVDHEKQILAVHTYHPDQPPPRPIGEWWPGAAAWERTERMTGAETFRTRMALTTLPDVDPAQLPRRENLDDLMVTFLATNGDNVPPILLSQEDVTGRWFAPAHVRIEDGNHRLAAARMAGLRFAPVVVIGEP